jgi:hypothetical protein
VAELPLPLADPCCPDMLRHGCFIGLAACAADRAAGLPWNPVAPAARDDLVVLAAWVDLAAAGCVTAGDALVDALAMVRPRPRLAPRTPAAMAVPASGREILICLLLPCSSHPEPGGSGAGHRGGPLDPVAQPKFCYRLRPAITPR